MGEGRSGQEVEGITMTIKQEEEGTLNVDEEDGVTRNTFEVDGIPWTTGGRQKPPVWFQKALGGTGKIQEVPGSHGRSQAALKALRGPKRPQAAPGCSRKSQDPPEHQKSPDIRNFENLKFPGAEGSAAQAARNPETTRPSKTSATHRNTFYQKVRPCAF